MSTPYTPDPAARHATITAITDNDAISAAAVSVPLEQLADNCEPAAFVLHAASSSYTVPAGVQYLEIYAVGPGSRGGTNNGGTSTGGAGGGCGAVRRRFIPVVAGMVFTTTIAAENSNGTTTVVCAASGLTISAPPGESSASKTNDPGYGADSGRRLEVLVGAGSPGSAASTVARAGDGDGGITGGVGMAGFTGAGGTAGTANAGGYTGKSGYGYGAGGPGQDGSGGSSGGGGGGGFAWLSPAGTPVGFAAGNAAVGGCVLFRPFKCATRAV